MRIGYARVSTSDQDTASQLPDLRRAKCKRIFEETESGGTLNRPELQKCLDRLEEGDTLVIWRLDRLGRSLRDLLHIVDGLKKRGIDFISLTENFDTTTAAGRLVFHFFGALAEFERDRTKERTLAGLSQARARGRVGGRPKKMSVQEMRVARTMWDSHKHTKQEIAEQFKVSVSTVDRIVRPQKTLEPLPVLPAAAQLLRRSRGGK